MIGQFQYSPKNGTLGCLYFINFYDAIKHMISQKFYAQCTLPLLKYPACEDANLRPSHSKAAALSTMPQHFVADKLI